MSTTPMMRQFNDAKKKYPNEILFFRMGDFYEMMFDDAIVASKILDITLTKRGKGTKSEAPMCGIPFHAAEAYIAKLVKHGHRVAICEQVEDARQAKGLVRREVVRVITPSTMLDDPSLDQRDFQFLAAIAEDGERLGLAFLDFGSGQFDGCEFGGVDRFVQAGELLMTRDPAELLVSSEASLDWLDSGWLKQRCVTAQDGWRFQLGSAEKELNEHFGTANLLGFGLEDKPSVAMAAGAALGYVNETQKSRAAHIESLRLLQFSDHLLMDATTQRNLELTRSLFDGNRHESLLGQIDRTKTSMGARLLKTWLLEPLLNIELIGERQVAITSFVDAMVARSEIRKLLGEIPDLDRLIGKLALATIQPREVGRLGEALKRLPELLECLDDVRDDRYGMEDPMLTALWDLHLAIEARLADEAPSHTRQPGMIKDGIDAELDELRGLRRDSKSALARIEARERERTGIPKLKIQYNKVFGYYIEVSKAYSESVPEDYVRKQTLVNSERYITDELKQYEQKILGAEERILEIEQRIYAELVARCQQHISAIRVFARTLAEMDVHAAMADLAVDRRYCRPQVYEGSEIVIVEGRHPVVEALSDEPFIANDTHLDMQDDRMQIITGPNMGGKSTYLRQVALITLMAHMGIYVPAKRAEVGLVDRIFTRVGASDHLARGQSTFMVEMIETANILHHASERSLIVLDEIGRGTSTFDGLSLAWATAEYITDPDRVGAKTLFATHYHEMTELERTCEGVRNYHITVREWQGEIVFLRRVERGAADQSYGIHVAKLAGLPKDVVRRAKEVLANLERNELDTSGQPRLAKGQGLTAGSTEPVTQLSLFPAQSSQLEEELLALDLDDCTPRKALEWLYQWKENL